jgi:hypothetical protein
MTYIYYDLTGFTGRGANPRKKPTCGRHPVTMSQLAWAAATIGTAPFGPRLHAAHGLELQWREAMMRASLRPTGGPFLRSRSYARLDPAEKSAVSFFLGQAQAKVFAEDFFGVGVFMHYDAYLSYLGKPRTKTRPDFIGFRGRNAIAAEVKGRSGGYTTALVRSAKKQAASIPPIAGHRLSAVYAHVAYFYQDAWCAYLDDPPQQRSAAGADPASVVAAYYSPIVSAIRSQGSDISHPFGADFGYLMAYFRDIDLTLSIPIDLAEHTPTDQDSPQMRESKAERLYQRVRPGQAEPPPDDEDSPINDEFRYLGSDGVLVELGSSWAQWSEDAHR